MQILVFASFVAVLQTLAFAHSEAEPSQGAKEGAVVHSQAAKALGNAQAEMKEAVAMKARATEDTTKALQEMKQAANEKSQAEREMSDAAVQAKQAQLSEARAKQASAAVAKKARQVEAERSEAAQDMSKASSATKQANAEKAKAEQTISKAIAIKSDAEKELSRVASQSQQLQKEQVQAEHASVKAKEEMNQAAAMKDKAVQEVSSIEATAQHKEKSAEMEMAKAEKDKEQAEQIKAEAAADVASMKVVFGCCFVCVLLLVVLVAYVFKAKLAVQDSLKEPLIAEEAPKPKPKAFEGRWKNEDGETVTIEGTQVVHGSGKQEQIADLENATLYTHRMSLQKNWFIQDKPEVRGSSGKLVGEKAIQWSDGRVWVKDDCTMGA